MTREEAIRKLQKQKSEYLEEWVDYSGVAEAYDIAIEALSAEPNCEKCAIKELWEETEKEDLVSVVRCKDCRWWNEDEFPQAFPEKKTRMCECPNIYGFNYFGRFTQEDEFCSRGERKEE